MITPEIIISCTDNVNLNEQILPDSSSAARSVTATRLDRRDFNKAMIPLNRSTPDDLLFMFNVTTAVAYIRDQSPRSGFVTCRNVIHMCGNERTQFIGWHAEAVVYRMIGCLPLLTHSLVKCRQHVTLETTFRRLRLDVSIFQCSINYRQIFINHSFK